MFISCYPLARLRLEAPFHHTLIEMKHGRRYLHLTCPWGGDSQLAWPCGGPLHGEQPSEQDARCSLQYRLCYTVGENQSIGKNSLKCLFLPPTWEARMVQRNLLPRNSCPWGMGVMSPSRVSHPPQKASCSWILNFLILNFGFWWWMNTACTSVVSYTHLCLKPSVCVSPFLPCFPNGTTRFSTTVVRMIHKTSLFGWVMYLHLLLQGIWWSSFLLLASPFGLRWLKCYSWEQPLLEYRLLFSTGSSCSSF